MSKSKILSMTLLVFGLVVLFSSTSMAQYGKIGYVDSDKIAVSYKAIVTAQEELETESKAWEDKAREMQKVLEEMEEEFDKQKLILSDEKKRERSAAIEAQRQALDAFTREIFGPSGAAERKYAALMKPIYDKINEAITRISTEGNYDIIFNSAALAFAKPEFDVTDKVIEILDEE